MRFGRTLGKYIDRLKPQQAIPTDAMRTEKAFAKVGLSTTQRSDLFNLRHSPGYTALLDLMEMSCIAQETNLVNAPVTDEAAVLAEHRLSKAFWQIFVSLQKKVEAECDAHLQVKSDEERRREISEPEQDDQQMAEVYSRS